MTSASTKTEALWKRAGIAGAVVAGMAAMANYQAGNISGLHATFQIVTAAIGVSNPVAGFVLSVLDVYLGEAIFHDGK